MLARLQTGVVLFLALALAGCASPRKRIIEPIRVDYDVHSGEFQRTISHLIGAPLVDSNRVTTLLNGDEFFPAMIEAIESARRSITFENFVWRPGELSDQFIEAFSKRARDGIKVHILIDALGSVPLRRSDLGRMRSAGVDLLKYNRPTPGRVFAANHRTHRRLLIVDGKIGFIGGISFADDWMGKAEPPRWRDTHYRVEGPMVAQMQGAFMDNWIQASGEVLHGADYFPSLEPAGAMKGQCFFSGPRTGEENARLAYLYSIAAARDHIRIAHSYFIPDDLAIEMLLAARRRGVKVELITPAVMNVKIVRRASRSRWFKLLEAGVDIYEYQPTRYHCKLVIVDNAWLMAGSVNFDDRSFYINDEANINVYDPAFVEDQIRIYEQDKALSRRVSFEEFKSRPWYRKLVDHMAGWFRGQL